MYVEIETHEKVIEALIAGLAQKNPKVNIKGYFHEHDLILTCSSS